MQRTNDERNDQAAAMLNRIVRHGLEYFDHLVFVGAIELDGEALNDQSTPVRVEAAGNGSAYFQYRLVRRVVSVWEAAGEQNPPCYPWGDADAFLAAVTYEQATHGSPFAVFGIVGAAEVTPTYAEVPRLDMALRYGGPRAAVLRMLQHAAPRYKQQVLERVPGLSGMPEVPLDMRWHGQERKGA